ncbi:hypothetical protein PoB_005746700 [Plakobranchus ocellatus]|uniref:G-protein coupled receptors family 1 profile domain-containing protein n=1 Tax=Plakobranchus ocellatus TaxID=259542 RepID=A0AAV4CI27_9GAST|nr:hypothetical protein PoB_005746700 [Plakobranchus ocellatus]
MDDLNIGWKTFTTVIILVFMLTSLSILFKIISLVGGIKQIPIGSKAREFNTVVCLAMVDVSLAVIIVVFQGRLPFQVLDPATCMATFQASVNLLSLTSLVYGAGFVLLAVECNKFKEQARVAPCPVMNSGGRIRIPVTLVSLSVSGVFWALSLTLAFSHAILGFQFDTKFCSSLQLSGVFPSTFYDLNFICLLLPICFALIAAVAYLLECSVMAFIPIKRKCATLITSASGFSPQDVAHRELDQPLPPIEKLSGKHSMLLPDSVIPPPFNLSPPCNNIDMPSQDGKLHHQEQTQQAQSMGTHITYAQLQQRVPTNPEKPILHTSAQMDQAALPKLPPRLGAYYVARGKAIIVSEIIAYCLCNIISIIIQLSYNLSENNTRFIQLYLVNTLDLMWLLLAMRGSVICFVRLASSTGNKVNPPKLTI